MNETDREILNLINARYPVIVVESHEELRVCEAIRAIALEMDAAEVKANGDAAWTTRIFHWAISTGMQQVAPEPRDAEKPDPRMTAAPPNALKFVSDYHTPSKEDPHGPKAIFVMKDFHHYVEQPPVLRALRDVAGELVNRHQTIVLLSPSFRVPADAEKEIAVVSYPLLTAEELAGQLDRFVEVLSERVPVNINGDRNVIARALQGLTRFEADAVLAKAVTANRALDLRAVDHILGEKAQIIKKSGVLEYWPAQARYEDVGGLDLLKAWCRQAMAAFSPEAAAFGIEPPRGFLAAGVPGSGKSLLAKAVAGGTMPLVRMDVGALMEGLVGASEANTRAALKTIEAVAPCVVWADELEKQLGGLGGEHDGGTSTRVLAAILTWMQETEAPVFIVATANRPEILPPELVRRFDESFFVDLPQFDERAEIFAIHLKKRGREPEAFDVEALAKATEGYTGAEVEKIVKAALRAAFAAGKVDVATEDLLEAAAATVPLSTTMKPQIEAMRQWASRARPASSRQESGHRVEVASGERAMMFVN